MKFRAALATVLLAASATAAVAQSPPTAPAAASGSATSVRPTSATASAATGFGSAGYRSAFEGYRRYEEQPVGSWREANDLVGRIGGWQAYAREGQSEGHDAGAMGNMPGMSMPGMETKPTGTSAEKAGASGGPEISMKGMPGMTMHGTNSKNAIASSRKEGAEGHETASLKGVPGNGVAGMAGMEPKARSTARTDGAAGHDMGAMKDMPGKSMSGATMAISQKAGDSDSKGRSGPVSGTGIVQGVDKANARVKLTHDPIAALAWPRMTMFFRLKDSALAEKVKEGDAVDFFLEKSASGYVISGLEKSPSQRETTKMK